MIKVRQRNAVVNEPMAFRDHGGRFLQIYLPIAEMPVSVLLILALGAAVGSFPASSGSGAVFS